MNTKHVISLDLAKALFEAGITKNYESEFYWVNKHKGTMSDGTPVWHLDRYVIKGEETATGQPEAYPALLLSELLELMPKTVADVSRTLWPTFSISGTEYTAMLVDRSREVRMQEVGKTPLDVAAKLASYLLREGKFNKPTL